MIKTLKKIDSWLDEGTDGYWSTPFPDIMTQDIARCKAKFNIKINPYCKNTVQKRKCVLAIVAIVIVLKILFGKDFGLVKTINSIPYWEFNDFVREAVGDSKVTAFWFYTIGCCGLSTLIISLLQTFLIGLKETRLLSVDGICVWLMNVYICGLCSDICHPIALLSVYWG